MEWAIFRPTGEERADDDDVLHIAQACFSHLQAQNLGSEGEHALHEFMRLAQSACKKVEEANALTQQVCVCTSTCGRKCLIGDQCVGNAGVKRWGKLHGVFVS